MTANFTHMKKETLSFSKEQVTKIVTDLKDSGTDNSGLMKVFLEAMMRAERQEHNELHNDQSNGYRSRKAFGHGRVLELTVPRTRHGNFYPVLLSVLKDQRAEMDRLGFSLYTKGLTTEQVGEVFEEIYGQAYSKQSISRMADMAREEVLGWLERPLESYYPIIYIDCTFVSVRRAGAVRKEAFYSILGVLPDRTREVLTIVAHPSESATIWREVFRDLKHRGLEEVNLVVSDSLSGIEDAVAAEFSGADHQLCVVHLMRNMAKKVNHNDRKRLMEEVKEIIYTYDRHRTPDQAYAEFQQLCNRWAENYRSFRNIAANDRYCMYFTFLKFNRAIHSMIYSTNWIERLNRDYKRVLKMRGALPNEQAVLVLMASVAINKKAYERKLPTIDRESSFTWL